MHAYNYSSAPPSFSMLYVTCRKKSGRSLAMGTRLYMYSTHYVKHNVQYYYYCNNTHTHTPCTWGTRIHSYSPPHQSRVDSLSDRNWSPFWRPSVTPPGEWWLWRHHPPVCCSGTALSRGARPTSQEACPPLGSQCHPNRRLEGTVLLNLWKKEGISSIQWKWVQLCNMLHNTLLSVFE